MGKSSSKQHDGTHPGIPKHSALPVDLVPYAGPMLQYSFMNVSVQMQAHMGFNFAPGTSMVTSNVDNYYPVIAQQYKDGFKMVQFLKIPGSQQMSGIFNPSVKVPYQTVYCRKVMAEEQSTTWQLKIEKSMIFMSQLQSGLLFSSRHQPVTSDLSHLYQLVCQNSDAGGRFICMELTGQATSQGMGAAMSGISPGISCL